MVNHLAVYMIEVVEADTLAFGNGGIAPRDCGAMAAGLDPELLRPDVTDADTGAPVVGPGGTVEAGNRRLAAILEAYDNHPARAEAYREVCKGYAERVWVHLMDRPVVIRRRVARKEQGSAMHGESGHARAANDAYFTIDAGWIVPALLSTVRLRGPVLEPCAGKGHLVDALAAAGYSVAASDLIDYGRGDIFPNVDLFTLTADDAAAAGSIVCNLPYVCIDEATAHLLDIAATNGLQVCSLIRAEWIIAASRRDLVQRHPALDKIVYLTKRPRWSEEQTASPRHWFAWVVWDFQRDPSQPPTVAWAGPSKTKPKTKGQGA